MSMSSSFRKRSGVLLFRQFQRTRRAILPSVLFTTSLVGIALPRSSGTILQPQETTQLPVLRKEEDLDLTGQQTFDGYDLSWIRSLNLDDSKMEEEEILKALASMPNLEKLRMPSFKNKICLEGSVLGKLPKLKELHLSFFESSGSLKGLTNHPGLEKIKIWHAPRLTELEPLSTIPNLKSLEISCGYKITTLNGLVGAKNLTKIAISFAYSTPLEAYGWNPEPLFDLGALTEKNFPKLEAFSLSADRIGSLSFVKSLPGLKSLELDSWKKGMDLTPLRYHPSLKQVQVCKADVKNQKSWKALMLIPNLELLFGDGVHALSEDQKLVLEQKGVEYGDYTPQAFK